MASENDEKLRNLIESFGHQQQLRSVLETEIKQVSAYNDFKGKLYPLKKIFVIQNYSQDKEIKRLGEIKLNLQQKHVELRAVFEL